MSLQLHQTSATHNKCVAAVTPEELKKQIRRPPRVSVDAGLLAYRELDETLALTTMLKAELGIA